jgi:hypothetical protein
VKKMPRRRRLIGLKSEHKLMEAYKKRNNDVTPESTKLDFDLTGNEKPIRADQI